MTLIELTRIDHLEGKRIETFSAGFNGDDAMERMTKLVEGKVVHCYVGSDGQVYPQFRVETIVS